ncbi:MULTISPECIES: transporter substrate-binding domain-containing protein [unclassified Streptomyces]|uniref:transporter substrate-binding domain-containing protein n=1 Tax=unclassified Streptomyces TaxID=2593676 RepID=UPI000DC77B3A|nr:MULTISPECIES: transporter substrate-binding domain-containing protein [unclassified Streptomyces]AWZ08873.1 ABC transporter substrate-binding protein [Streptomyces sp. ICC4]AWZ16904.1 ABC transporter substrate-binding protein [Streptomyces sp. ICC1]
MRSQSTTLRTRLVRGLGAATATAALAAGLTACGGDAKASGTASDKVTVGAVSNGAAQQAELSVPVVESLRAQLPEAVRERGELVIGVGALPAGFPPLAYVGTDQKTLTGAEPDLGRLVAATLGLKPVVKNSTWENLFVGIDSGKVDVAFSNVTVTEERKKKYDFASYRQDNLAFEALKESTWNFAGDHRNLAGKTVSVSKGTNQEKILLEWQKKLQAEGKDITVKYFPDANSVYLALSGKKIDLNFGPNPSIAYHVTQTAGGNAPTRNAGSFSGAGETLQGLIAATAKKDSGLAKPVAEAINHLAKNGRYAQLLTAWNLSNEAVTTSEVNPPGLPVTNS